MQTNRGRAVYPLARTDETSSAIHFLGDELFRAILSAQDAAAHATSRQSWHEVRAELAGKEQRFADLQSSTTNEARRERALLAGELLDDEAIPYLEDAVAAAPDDAELRLALGRALLDAQRPDCVEHLSRAALDLQYAAFANLMISAHFADRGDLAQAREYRKRARDGAEELDTKDAKQLDFSEDTTFEPPTLDEAAMARISRALLREEFIERGYLLKRAVEHRPDTPLHILLIEVRSRWLGGPDAEDTEAAVERIVSWAEVATPFLMLVHGAESDWLLAAARGTEGAEIFDRRRKHGPAEAAGGSARPVN